MTHDLANITRITAGISYLVNSVTHYYLGNSALKRLQNNFNFSQCELPLGSCGRFD